MNASIGIGFNPLRCFWWTEYFPLLQSTVVPSQLTILQCTNLTQCGYGRLYETPSVITQTFPLNYTPLISSAQINLYVVCYNDMPTSNFPSPVINAWQFTQATNNTSNIVINNTGNTTPIVVVTNNTTNNITNNVTNNNTTNVTNKTNGSSSSIIQISYILLAFLGLFLVLLH